MNSKRKSDSATPPQHIFLFADETSNTNQRAPSNYPNGISFSMDESQHRDLAYVEKRSAHNALERQRREGMNTKYQDLAHVLPCFQEVKRPSKNMIVTKSLEFVRNASMREKNLKNILDTLKKEHESLQRQSQLVKKNKRQKQIQGESSKKIPRQASIQSTIIQNTPIQSTSIQQAPIQQAPIQQAPIQQAPIVQNSIQQAPIRQESAHQMIIQQPQQQTRVFKRVYQEEENETSNKKFKVDRRLSNSTCDSEFLSPTQMYVPSQVNPSQETVSSIPAIRTPVVQTGNQAPYDLNFLNLFNSDQTYDDFNYFWNY